MLLCPRQRIDLADPAIAYPMLASEKYDGFRCLAGIGKLWMRGGKAFPNQQLRERFADFVAFCDRKMIVFDGELYDPASTFPELQSMLQSRNAPLTDTLRFHAFDQFSWSEWWGDRSRRFQFRQQRLSALLAQADCPHVLAVPHVPVSDADHARRLFDAVTSQGGEGIMLRNPLATHKHGSATVRDNIIFRFKPAMAPERPASCS